MTTTLTPNLRLRVDDTLSSNAKYNLQRIDALGAVFFLDNTETVNLRSKVNINLLPNDSSTGGSGVGGTVSFGTSSQALTAVNFYSSPVFFSQGLSFADTASGSAQRLSVRYKSDINSAANTTTSPTLSISLTDDDRALSLDGDFFTDGGDITLTTTAGSSVTLPASGILVTQAGSEPLTNKTIAAASNTITGLTSANLSASAGISYPQVALTGSIVNSDVSNSAAIAYSKLNLSGSILGSDVAVSAAIPYSKLSLTSSIVNADVAPGASISYSKLNLGAALQNSDVAPNAAISRSKVANGAASEVVINDGSGGLSSEAQLATTRGGTGVSGTASYPTSGTVATDTNTLTLQNKTLSGSLNTFSAIPYSSLTLSGSIVNGDVSNSAGISYTKLSLSDSIVNADIASAAAIAGTKIVSLFETQWVQSDLGFQWTVGGHSTYLQAAQGGQAADLTFELPATYGVMSQVLTTNGSGTLSWASPGAGTVTSVGLSMPAAVFSVANSPVTNTGTLTVTFATQSANLVWAGPATGAAATPTFRALVAADLPLYTASRALQTDGTGAIGPSAVTTTELGYLSGVTASVQTQLDGKEPDLGTPAGDGYILSSTTGDIRSWISPAVLVQTFKADWVTADGTTKVVTHSLGTLDVAIQLYDKATGDTILVDAATRTDLNTVTLTSSQAPNASGWRVLIQKV